MKRYELTEIKAIANGDTEVQDAILVHDCEYGFHDQDNIIFDAELDRFNSDADVEEALQSDYCTTYSRIENDIYYAV